MKGKTKLEVDYTRLRPGVYICQHNYGTTTFDLRFVRPNHGVYLPSPVMHTIEHLDNSYLRSREVHNIGLIYFGPMSSRTGFYLVVSGWQNPLHKESPIFLTIKSMLKFIIDFEGEIPGANARECSNYEEHDLAGAKEWAAKYLHWLKKPHFLVLKNIQLSQPLQHFGRSSITYT